MSIANPTLPDGWTSEVIDEHNTVLKAPFGMVTVCWGKGSWYATRGFRSGWAVTGQFTSTAKYEGRGWKERLVDDAVKWLQDVEAAYQRRQKRRGSP